jgi:hypothetical protein
MRRLCWSVYDDRNVRKVKSKACDVGMTRGRAGGRFVSSGRGIMYVELVFIDVGGASFV